MCADAVFFVTKLIHQVADLNDLLLTYMP